MNWSDTVERAYRVAKNIDPTITRPQVELTMRAMRAVFFDAAERHEDITWHGILSARYHHCPERTGWNPANKAPLIIPEHYRVTLRPGENLKVAVGQKDTTKHYTRPDGWWREAREAKQALEDDGDV